jgi:hypothetical protein
VTAEAITNYIITDRAAIEINRRGLTAKTVAEILESPEQRFDVRQGRVVLQSRIEESGLEYLVRVFVDIDRNPAEVVTAYRTSKVLKYWRF